MAAPKPSQVLQWLLIVALAWAAVYLGRDEIRGLVGEKEPPAAARAVPAGSDEGFEVRVTPEVQKAGGIETRALEARELRPSLPMQGRILQLDPLIEDVAHFQAATAESRGLRAAVERTRAEHRRAVTLYEADRTASQRAVETADAERIAAEAHLAEAESRARASAHRLRQAWGAEIARWAMAEQSPQLERLLRGQDVLLMMTLAPEYAAPRGEGALDFASSSSPGSQRQATAVSPAPRSDPAFPGATYLFRADAEGLRAGERVSGRLAIGGSPMEGVLVPESALVWHGGTAWVFVQETPDRFERRAVSTRDPTPGGWFDGSLEPGDPVVVRGAQLLLSEEFRGQITNENED